MVTIKPETKAHPTEIELAALLSNSLSSEARERIEGHIAGCDECLERIASAHEAVEEFKKRTPFKRRKDNIMRKINLYLALAIVSFTFSFAVPRYFIQFLVATLVLGIKWVVDSKSTKMLITIYEAWKTGGEREASRILESLDSKFVNRIQDKHQE